MSNPQPARALAEPCSSRASSPITVVVADDHELMRRSLRLALGGEEDVEVIAEAGDLLTAVREVNGHLPDVLVLDLQMPDGSSIELIRQLRLRVPETEVVVVTMEDGPAYARAAIDAGAMGFVLKQYAAHDLPVAVRCAARGEQYVSARVGARLDALQRSVDDDGLEPTRGGRVAADRVGANERRDLRQALSLQAHGGIAPQADPSQAGAGTAFRASRVRARARPDQGLTAHSVGHRRPAPPARLLLCSRSESIRADEGLGAVWGGAGGRRLRRWRGR